MVRFNGPPTAGEAETQARSVCAFLLERVEEVVRIPTWETAAFVHDLDEHPFHAHANSQGDGRPPVA
jgi:hypothetical protein